MTTLTFQEVSIRASKSGICQVCNKRASRSEKFWQTINPFNKTADGHVKGRDEIHAELMASRAEWLKQPIRHVKCEAVQKSNPVASLPAA